MEWCQLRPFYPLASIRFTSSLFAPLSFSPRPPTEYPPPPPPPPPPLSLVGHAKAYDRVAPRQPNEADMTTTTMYPVTTHLQKRRISYRKEATLLLKSSLFRVRTGRDVFPFRSYQTHHRHHQTRRPTHSVFEIVRIRLIDEDLLQGV